MTPNLTTPEGRAALRAYYPPGGTLKIDAHMNAALDALDAAHATIERLTAPVTEEEGFDVVSLLGRGWSPDHVLDAFIAWRKEPAP